MVMGAPLHRWVLISCLHKCFPLFLGASHVASLVSHWATSVSHDIFKGLFFPFTVKMKQPQEVFHRASVPVWLGKSHK